MTWVEKNILPEKGFFNDITKWLKDLMSKITWGINEILVSLWLKKKEEIKQEIDKSQQWQVELQIWIKLENNQDFKDFDSWLKNLYNDEDIVKQIKDNIKKEIIDKTEKIEDIDKNIKDILETTKNSLEKIKDNKDVKDIVNTIYAEKDIKEKYSINQIILAYDEIKGDDEDKKPTKEDVLAKLKESE